MAHGSRAVEGQNSQLIKQNLAAKLKEEIIQGRLAPGQPIVEGLWAKKFGAAQTSVREAINLLIAEGFATKASGKSARVTCYSEEDIAQIFELRGVLEGLSARLVAQRQPDLASLETALKQMRKATKSGNPQTLVEADLHFHLRLCELSGNRFLREELVTMLVPLFAFVSMRVVQHHRTALAWESDLARHRRIIELIREGDPIAAEFAVRATIQQFSVRAYRIWRSEET
jgi:GntR family transcriptional regulator, trigonelline degradation regulator